jgi:hypothetical protein
MNSWFTVKVKYTKQLENGTFKRVSEPYLLAAMTFTDAEARIYEELGSSIRGEFQVTGTIFSNTTTPNNGSNAKSPMTASTKTAKKPKPFPKTFW